MAVRIRMMRLGRRHRPFFRINAMEGRNPRNGRILEKLGHYDPIEKDPEKQVVINLERVQYWLDHGASCSDSINDLLKTKGIVTKAAAEKDKRREKAKAIARKKGKPFTKAEVIAIEKAAEKVSADAEAKAKEKEAKAKEKEAKAKEAEEAAKAAEEAKVEEPAEAPVEKAKAEEPAETETPAEPAEEAKPEEPEKAEEPAETKAPAEPEGSDTPEADSETAS